MTCVSKVLFSGGELTFGGVNKNLVGGVYWGDEQIFGLWGYSPHPPSRENLVQWWYVYKSRMRNCGKSSEYDSVSWEGAV